MGVLGAGGTALERPEASRNEPGEIVEHYN
jgi:hypothetical protein